MAHNQGRMKAISCWPNLIALIAARRRSSGTGLVDSGDSCRRNNAARKGLPVSGCQLFQS